MNLLYRYIEDLDVDKAEDRDQLVFLRFLASRSVSGAIMTKKVAAREYSVETGRKYPDPDDDIYFSRLPEYVKLAKKDFVCISIQGATRDAVLKFRNTFQKDLEEDNYTSLLSLVDNKLRQEDRTAEIVSSAAEDTETVKEVSRKLTRKIRRGFTKNKYISDIRITASEYSYLKRYLHDSFINGKIPADPLMFAVAVVQVAIRTYDEGNFWGTFFRDIGVENSYSLRRKIGDAFYDTLTNWSKAVVSRGETRDNVMLHAFVSDKALPEYFEFLFKFYTLDLDRDLSNLDREQMNELIASITAESMRGRTHLLLQHTRQAIASNITGAKIRIRNQLKRMDKLFWDPDEINESDHRIYSAMDEWSRNSESFNLERSTERGRRRRGVRRFSNPFFRFDHVGMRFVLVLPEQKVSFDYGDEVHWDIPNLGYYGIDAELRELTTSYKTTRFGVVVNGVSMLKEQRILLESNCGTVRIFKHDPKGILFFDASGNEVSITSIHTGDYTVVVPMDSEIESDSITGSSVLDDVRVYFCSFVDDDLLTLPNGRSVLIGRDKVETTMLEKGRLDEVRSFLNNDSYEIYNESPYFTVRLRPDLVNGAAFVVDGIPFRIGEAEKKEITIEDGSGDVGYLINLSRITSLDNGYHRIILDLPNGIRREWLFCLIRGIQYEFEDSPYLFEPRGTVVLQGIKVTGKESGLIKRRDSDGVYEFEIEKVGRYLDFSVTDGTREYELKIPVPALFIMNQDGNWTNSRLPSVWHSELPDLLRISAPGRRISLFTQSGDDENGYDDVDYIKTGATDYFECDLTRIKSRISVSGKVMCPVFIYVNGVAEELIRVMTRNVVVSRNIIGDTENQSLLINVDYLGKDSCCVDVIQGDELIADKLVIADGRVSVPVEHVGGRYIVSIYDVSDDDSGFGPDYLKIDEFEQAVIDPYDLTGRSLKILSIIEKTKEVSSLSGQLPLLYQNYIENLKKTEDDLVYEGTLVVERTEGDCVAALKARVTFDSLTDPENVVLKYHNRYDEDVDFLYDTRYKGILVNENNALTRRAQYRRYTVLYDDDYLFRIEFCERDYTDTDNVPTDIVYPEYNNSLAFTGRRDPDSRASGTVHKARPLQEIFSVRASNALSRIGIFTDEELVSYVRRYGNVSLRKVRNLGLKDIERIESFVASY